MIIGMVGAPIIACGFGAVLIGLFSIPAAMAPAAKVTPAPSPTPPPAPPVPVFQIGQTFTTGTIGMRVRDVRWSPDIGKGEVVTEKADGCFVVIYFDVRNEDTVPKKIPQYQLADTNGRIFSDSGKGIMMDDRLRGFEEVNPGVEKKCVEVYDLPRKSAQYFMLIPGDGDDPIGMVQLPLPK